MNRPKTVIKRPSGAFFRKRKLEAEETQKSVPKITKHFLTQSVAQVSNNPNNPTGESSENTDNQGESDRSQSGDNLGNQTIDEEFRQDGDDLQSSGSSTEKIPNIINSDIGLFLNSTIDHSLREKILSLEPCQPCGPFPRDPITNRSFSTDYYYAHSTSRKIRRQWLCYSQMLNAVYCDTCWLFADRNNKNYKDSWTSGKINHWQKLSQKIKKHETSEIHLQACIAHGTFTKNINQIQRNFEAANKEWKEVLLMILDTLVTMASCTIPIRGHRENVHDVDIHSGNFLNIIELLSRYNPVMKNHIQNPDRKIKHLSPDIQNELLELSAGEVLEVLTKEIRESSFLSLILDTTQDISKKDQLSLILRYVKSCPEKGLIVKESFLGFIHVIDQGAECITGEVLKFLETNNIDISRCRGQGYDGASVMSGKYSGIQARIKSIAPQADYIHCVNHNLNLVVNDCVEGIVPIKNFYGIVEQLYLFFNNSLPRWQKLIENGNKNNKGAIIHALKKLCPTRWSSRFESVSAIRNNFTCIVNTLTTIRLLSKKKSEVDDADALMKNISHFDFVIMLVFQYKILEQVNHVAKILQYHDIKLNDACKWLRTVLEAMERLRLDFNTFQEEATALAKDWKIQPIFKTKRIKTVKKFYDEQALDDPIIQPLQRFRIEVFNRALDLIIQQLKLRFQSMNAVNDLFSFLNPESLLNQSNDRLIEAAGRLQTKYRNDLEITLATEVIGFKNLIYNELKEKKISSFRDIIQYLFVDHCILQSSFPNLCSAILLYLTLPVTAATAEKSFSKLKLIKTYLSNNMCQIRLSSIAVLSIENAVAKGLDMNKIVDKFLSLKNRRGLH